MPSVVRMATVEHKIMNQVTARSTRLRARISGLMRVQAKPAPAPATPTQAANISQ